MTTSRNTMVLSSIVARAYKVYKISKRFDQRVKFADPTNKFIRKYVPPNYRKKAYRFNKYAQIATGGGLIYDLVNEIGSALQKQPSNAPSKFTETRRRFSTNNRSRLKHGYYPCRCRKQSRKRFPNSKYYR